MPRPSRAPRRRTALTSPAPCGYCSLGQLDHLVHDGVLGGAPEVQELEQAQAQDRQHRRVEAGERALDELRGDVVERGPPLDGAEAEGHGQRPVARFEAGRLRRERAIGVGALLEHPADDAQGAGARRGDAATGAGGGRSGHLRAPAPQVVLAAHRPPPGRLDDQQLERALGAAEHGPGPRERHHPGAVGRAGGGVGGLPSPSTRAALTPRRVPSSRTTYAPMWGVSARTTRSSSTADRLGSSSRSGGSIFAA